jgi:hypothetical protein
VTTTRGSGPSRSPNISMSHASGYRQEAISSHHVTFEPTETKARQVELFWSRRYVEPGQHSGRHCDVLRAHATRVVGSTSRSKTPLRDRGELSTAIKDLHSRRERGLLPPFRRLVVESTGLADPFPILSTVRSDPVLRHHFCLGNVITTVEIGKSANTSPPANACARARARAPARRACGRGIQRRGTC